MADEPREEQIDLDEFLFEVPAKEYGDHYQNHLLGQYKLYVQMADKISERRQSANSFFLTINTALIAFLGLVASPNVGGDAGVAASPPLPWERRYDAGRLTPVRVRRVVSSLLVELGTPAKAPKPCGRSPGRPKGRLSGRAKRYPAIKQAA